MTATNCITGHPIKSRVTSEKYADNWDAVFKKKDKQEETCKHDGSEDIEAEPKQDDVHRKL